MNIQIIYSGTYKSRKRYRDDGWEWLQNWIDGGCYVCGNYVGESIKIPFCDYRKIIQIKNSPTRHLIRPGEMYERQFSVCDGDLGVFRTKKEIAEIGFKYNIFNED